MLPIDLLGGYILPRRFGRSVVGFEEFLRLWGAGVAIQSLLFVLAGLGILAAARWGGVGGAVAVIFSAASGYLLFQGALTRLLTKGEWRPEAQGVPDGLLDDTIAALDRLQDDEPPRSAIVETIFHPVTRFCVCKQQGTSESLRSARNRFAP